MSLHGTYERIDFDVRSMILFFSVSLDVELHVGTQKLMGSTQWEASAGKGIITRVGGAQFNVQHVKAIFVISQSLDTRKRPEINDIQLELGNIQVSRVTPRCIRIHSQHVFAESF